MSDDFKVPIERLISSFAYYPRIFDYKHGVGGRFSTPKAYHPVVAWTNWDNGGIRSALEIFEDFPLVVGTQTTLQKSSLEGWGISSGSAASPEEKYAEFYAISKEGPMVTTPHPKSVSIIRAGRVINVVNRELLRQGDKILVAGFDGAFGLGYMGPRETWPAMPIGRAIAVAGQEIGRAFLAKFRK